MVVSLHELLMQIIQIQTSIYWLRTQPLFCILLLRNMHVALRFRIVQAFGDTANLVLYQNQSSNLLSWRDIVETLPMLVHVIQLIVLVGGNNVIVVPIRFRYLRKRINTIGKKLKNRKEETFNLQSKKPVLFDCRARICKYQAAGLCAGLI